MRQPARVAAVPGVLVQLLEVVAEGPVGVAPRSTGVFPLGLRRQPVAVAAEHAHLLALDAIVRLQSVPLAQAVAEGDCVDPANRVNRMPGRGHSLHTVAGATLRCELARVDAHYLLILLLRYLVLSQAERLREFDAVP